MREDSRRAMLNRIAAPSLAVILASTVLAYAQTPPPPPTPPPATSTAEPTPPTSTAEPAQTPSPAPVPAPEQTPAPATPTPAPTLPPPPTSTAEPTPPTSAPAAVPQAPVSPAPVAPIPVAPAPVAPSPESPSTPPPTATATPGVLSNAAGNAYDRHDARGVREDARDRKSTRLNSSHQIISYAVFCLKKKKPTPKLHSHNLHLYTHLLQQKTPP